MHEEPSPRMAEIIAATVEPAKPRRQPKNPTLSITLTAEQDRQVELVRERLGIKRTKVGQILFQGSMPDLLKATETTPDSP